MTQAASYSPTNPMRAVLANRDFRLLWIGQGTSLIGDQFHMIAAPWLVLQLTNDPLALGTVFALGSIPRAILMLFGGVITDRFSPRAIMLVSDLVRLVITGLMAVQVATGTMQVWMLYIYSLIFGIVSGFFMPASQAVVPDILPAEELQAGNSVFSATMQLISFVGPAVAGAVIAAFGQTSTGMAIAFSVDAISFLISTVMLWLMTAMQPKPGEGNMLEAIRAGLVQAFQDPVNRMVLLVVAAANFLFSGPLLIGMPVLANTRLPEGAAAYGLVISGYAGGNLAGILSAGVLPRYKAGTIRWLFIALLVSFGLGLASFGIVTNTWLAFGVMVAMGIGNGYLGLMLITNLQRNTPKEMLGRLMSIFMLANIGLAPFSQAITGLVLRWTITGLFFGASFLMFALTLAMATRPELGTLAEQLAGEPVAIEKE